MASSGKKKTTMAKLTRESRLRERRLDKQARKNARKYAAAHPEEQSDTFSGETDLSAATGEIDLSAATGETDPSTPSETEPAAAQAVAQAIDA
jgi:hypothetical protein